MILWVDCRSALDLPYGWNVSRLTKHVSVHTCFLHKLKEANLLFCIWLHTDVNMVDMYTKNMSPCLYNRHRCTIVHDANDNDEECRQYLHKILDISHITITNSPGEALDWDKVLPIPSGEYEEYSGESGGLLE